MNETKRVDAGVKSALGSVVLWGFWALLCWPWSWKNGLTLLEFWGSLLMSLFSGVVALLAGAALLYRVCRWLFARWLGAPFYAGFGPESSPWQYLLRCLLEPGVEINLNALPKVLRMFLGALSVLGFVVLVVLGVRIAPWLAYIVLPLGALLLVAMLSGLVTKLYPYSPDISLFSEAELARRLRVWDAWSELWLDNDASEDLPWIASRLAESPYSLWELLAIHRYEVAPALASNLSLYGGWEWAGFSEEHLRKVCLEAAWERGNPFYLLLCWMLIPFRYIYISHYLWRLLPLLLAARRERRG